MEEPVWLLLCACCFVAVKKVWKHSNPVWHAGGNPIEKGDIMSQYVTVSDGTRIAVYDPNPGGRRAMLLLHGWPLSHDIFEYQIPFLLCRGYRVVTLDFRGFGDSEMTFAGYGYDRMAQDVNDVVRKLGLWNFVLGGFSMGGAVALRYMRRYGGYGVSRLMLFAAAAPSFTRRPGFPLGRKREEVEALIEQACADRAQLCYDFSHEQLLYGEHSEAIRNWLEDISLSASGHGTIQAAISLRDEDGRMDLEAVNVPTAIFQGGHDLVVPRDLTMYQQECITGSVLYELENSGHALMYDELQNFNNYMLEFIEK